MIMFEVGKRYTYKNGSGQVWEINAIGKSSALASCLETGDGYFTKGREYNIGADAFKSGDFSKWTEVLPEPKRWSTWQNIYPNFCSYIHNSRQQADNMGHGREGIIRRDYEQHEGKEPVCVSFVLEKV